MPRDGLGFPIVPIIMGATSLVGLLKHKSSKPKISTDQAKGLVRQIYLELLERDPWNPYDAGAEGYVNCLVEGWCDTDFIRTEVLKAPEYHDVQARKAAAVYGTAPQAAAGTVPPSGASMGPAMAAGGFGIPPTIAGIPTTYLVGGLALLMLLKKR